MNCNERFSVQLMCRVREIAHLSLGEDISVESTEPRGLSARFLIDLTTKVAGIYEESVEGRSAINKFLKQVHKISQRNERDGATFSMPVTLISKKHYYQIVLKRCVAIMRLSCRQQPLVNR